MHRPQRPTLAFILLAVLAVAEGRSLGNGCDLPLDTLNRLVSKLIDEETFGVDPVVGLGTQHGVSTSAAVDEVLDSILKVNTTYTRQQLRPCVEAYLRTQLKPSQGGSNAEKPTGGLSYNTPWYLGGGIGLGVPVPDDEEYKPDSDGYTTYINPHNFLQSVTGYMPAALFRYNSILKFFTDALNKAQTDIDQVLDKYTPDIDSWLPKL